MKTNEDLQRDVLDELAWDPAVDAADIGVIVNDGVVTLTGHLSSYAEKHAAERAVQRVQGVKAVAVEIDVRLSASSKRTDTDIARAAESALLWHTAVAADRITVMVESGWVTLSGELDWDYQRRSVEKAIRLLTGVTGVTNSIRLKPQAVPGDVQNRIRAALTRQALREADRIKIEIDGGVVTLRGTVHSNAERSAAHGSAWSAPGVTRVVDHLTLG